MNRSKMGVANNIGVDLNAILQSVGEDNSPPDSPSAPSHGETSTLAPFLMTESDEKSFRGGGRRSRFKKNYEGTVIKKVNNEVHR